MKEADTVCTYCGMLVVGVEIHGHIQCEHCGNNLAPCCEGSSGCSTQKSDSL